MKHFGIPVHAIVLAVVALAGGCGGQSLPPGSIRASTTAPATVPESSDPASGDEASPVTTTSVLESTSPSTTPVPTVYEPAEGPRLDWRGRGLFLAGANLPWNNWGCDFGCGADGGVSSEEGREQIAAALNAARTAGLGIVRWWLFPGDPGQFETDAAGLPTGLALGVYQDVDAALALAEEHDVTYVFTLFSAPSALPSSWLETVAGRNRLVEVLGQFFAHYRDEPRIHTWQVINEPEWEIWNDIVSEDDVRDLVMKVASSVHENSTALVSVGSARLDGLPMWVGTGLDYYTAHWYDPMGDGEWCAICTDYPRVSARYAFDAPLVIGEFHAGVEVGAEQRFNELYDRGYAGAWAWSLLPDRTLDGLAIDLEGSAAFADRHDDLAP
jgi:hypothetical protein